MAIILIYVVLIIWITCKYVMNTEAINRQFNTCKLNESEFRTGDLVFFRYEYFDIPIRELTLEEVIDYHMMLVSLYDKWPIQFSHIGMIIVIGDTPYIMQAANYPVFSHSKKCLSHRMDLYDFNEYVNNYHGDVYHVPYVGPELNIALVYRSMKFVQQLPFKYDINTYIDMLSGNVNPERKNKSITCSSGVLYMLNLVGVINEPNDNFNRHSPSAVYVKAANTGMYANPIILINNWARGIKTRDICSPTIS